jgi:hypothetical protein
MTSPFLNFKGLSGAIYRLDPATDTPMLDDDTGLPVVLDASGFYRVEYNHMDVIRKTVTIKITPFSSKKKFIRNSEQSAYGGGTPIIYHIHNRDEVLDEVGAVVTPGTFDTWFATSIVQGNNTSEAKQALLFVKSLNGTSPVQATFPVDFSTMTIENITQANINNALGL